MGRLLAALIAETVPALAATPATIATLTPESRKVAIVAAPNGFQTARLLSALRSARLPDEWVGLDHGCDSDLEGLTDKQLAIYVRMFADADMREKGRRPADETSAALCGACGPVWVHASVAAVAPGIDGWPSLLGCPSCHVKNRQALARPSVTCGYCRHFVRDAINSAAGTGHCGAGVSVDRSTPMARHECATFTPS